MREVVAVLDNIRSVHNVGAILRTADGAGITTLYLCGVTPSPVNAMGHSLPQMAKVSLGAEEYLEWHKASSAARVLNKLKSQGYYLVAIEQGQGSQPISRAKKVLAKAKKKVALIVGNEVTGISSAVLKRADAILEIPMRGRKESLNVSVAFGIAAYVVA